MPLPDCTFSRMGRPNAAVFPEPVLDWPKMSFPCMIDGMHFSWMGVRSVNPISCRARKIGCCSGNSLIFIVINIP